MSTSGRAAAARAPSCCALNTACRKHLASSCLSMTKLTATNLMLNLTGSYENRKTWLESAPFSVFGPCLAQLLTQRLMLGFLQIRVILEKSYCFPAGELH